MVSDLMQAAIASLRETPAYLRARERLLLLSFSPEDQDPDRELDFLLAAAEATRRNGRVRSAVAGIKQRRNGRGRRLRFTENEAEPAGRVRMPVAECDAQHNSSPVSVLEAPNDLSTTTTSSPWKRWSTQSPARLPQVRHVHR